MKGLVRWDSHPQPQANLNTLPALLSNHCGSPKYICSYSGTTRPPIRVSMRQSGITSERTAQLGLPDVDAFPLLANDPFPHPRLSGPFRPLHTPGDKVQTSLSDSLGPPHPILFLMSVSKIYDAKRAEIPKTAENSRNELLIGRQCCFERFPSLHVE